MLNSKEPLLLILSSPSGAGKTTLTHRLLRDFQGDIVFSVSHTTRSKRPAEVDGQDYHFVTRETFRELVSKGQFAEWAEVHGNFYGTSVAEVERARGDGKRGIIFDVDYQGARQIKAKFPQAIGIFILPPSMEELRRRLEGRGTETPESIEKRFAKAREEIEHYPFFDYLVLNDDLQEALASLVGIVRSAMCTRARMAAEAEALLG